MAERKNNWTNDDKIAAWENVAGVHTDSTKVYGIAECPVKFCQFQDRRMEWSKYGNDTKRHWVIDHKVSLDNGGTNHRSNLQAMHNYCNSVKSNTY